MYKYEWDAETGGYILTSTVTGLPKEIRPVFFEELEFLQLDKNFGWKFPQAKEPLCWAEGRKYFYRGEMVFETQGGNLFEMPTLKNVAPTLSLEPVNISAMIQKNKNLMDGLIQRTLKNIYATFKEYSGKVDIFYVAFSGGKDSLVMLDLIQRALPHDSFEIIFGDTSMELSDTYQTVEIAKTRWQDLHWHTAKAPFNALDSWKFMGPPARKIRWCCSVHKAAPSLFKIREILGDKKIFKAMAFVGVRAEESLTRSTYEQISTNKKFDAQINFYPILDWLSAELFLYIFYQDLPLNHSYRIGLHRVGCLLCPMSSGWTDCINNNFHGEEFAPYVEIIKNSLKKTFDTEKDLNEYLSEKGWKNRASGKIILQGEDKIFISKQENQQKYLIKNSNYSWKNWMTALGDFVEIAPNKYSINYEGESIIFDVEKIYDAEVITLNIFSHDKKIIGFLSLFKNVLYKAAYCKNCRVCMAKCPSGALKITTDDVVIKNCVHCHLCLEMQKGCWVARSFEFGGNNDEMNISGIDKYKTFGLRSEWIKIYFEDNKNFWNNDRMGKVMFDSFKVWGKEIGLLDEKKNALPIFEKLSALGAESLKVWGIFWINLAYNSAVTNIFVKNVDFNSAYDNNFFMEILGDSLKERTKQNAMNALKDTFRSSPIGEGLQQGICELKGRQVISITRKTWENPEPLVILYSLYKFAEKSDGQRSFTLTELLADSGERTALSPQILFGVNENILRPILQGLANNYPNFIRVDFNKEIMENIFLAKDKAADDVIDLF